MSIQKKRVVDAPTAAAAHAESPSSSARSSLRSTSLARRLILAMATMLLPLLAVAGTGLLTFRASVGALEQVRDEIVDESKRIDTVRGLLVHADDLGEDYVEKKEPGMDERFATEGRRIDRAFDAMITPDALPTRKERDLASAARARWEEAFAAADEAAALPLGRYDAQLDDFHDAIDEAASMVVDLYSLHVNDIADEISSLRRREHIQLFTGLTTLIISSIVAGLLARKVHRSITTPLLSLELAATSFGSDDLSHRIPVKGDDELSRVGRAFNAMAGRLQQSRDDLQYQALHDPLTGLPNRALFMERLERSIARSRRQGTPFSILYIDLDGFKAVNDTLGHAAGDEVLVAVSARLTDSLRAEDTLARLGGDEFGILLEEADSDGAAKVAGALGRLFGATIHVATGEVPIGASIGVTTWRADAELDQLLREADAAMYAAKIAGSRSYRVSVPDMKAEASGVTNLGQELKEAIVGGQLVLHYQPLVSLVTGDILGFEALVRWDHPSRGLLQPDDFICVAEKSGLIIELDQWVLNESCRQLATWKQRDPWFEFMYVSVNVSAAHFEDSALVTKVSAALQTSGLNARDLHLEVTESTLMRDKDGAAATLGLLKTLGVSLSLDDFGTGYSSLSYLRSFPLDALKIDRSFVADVTRPEEAVVTEAIIRLAQTLRLEVIAEGIEDQGQREELARLGCDAGQGYLFSKPIPARVVEGMVPATKRSRSIAKLRAVPAFA